LSESGPGGYIASNWSCIGGSLSGNQLTLAAGDEASCKITNNDTAPVGPDPDPDPGAQDVSVEKTMAIQIPGCPAINGRKVEYSITVENLGSNSANGVILNDYWDEQLKPSKSPDMFDCSLEKQRSARCKLGNIAAGNSKQLSFDYFLGGSNGDTVCNTARVASSPNETDNTGNNESTVCFPIIGQLGTQPDSLPIATVGNVYNASIEITGGLPPYEIAVSGLPYSGLGFEVDNENNRILITGCPGSSSGDDRAITVEAQYFGDSEYDACDSLKREYILSIEHPVNCTFDKLTSIMIEQRGISTGTGGGKPFAPDESVQKVVVNDDVNSPEYRSRYLVGFVYAEHNYASDPNGQFVEHDMNYDIRVVKYDDSGALQWDKTFDTGNDDYGYAVTLSADKQRVYVGGGSEFESKSQAWHDAVLLEIDSASGCSLGAHFQSAGAATTSAYYDIESDGAHLYAVGERQVNPSKQGDRGGLVSIFSHGEKPAGQNSCADQLIVSESENTELTWKQDLVREGAPPTVAYSVKLPESGCKDCNVLIGGIAGTDGWLDTLSGDAGNAKLTEFPATPAAGVQDIASQNGHIILVGSTPENNMKVQSFSRQGSVVWGPVDLGKGRLRAVATDANGFIYAAGTSDDEGSAGLAFKFDAAGNEITRIRLNPGADFGTGVAFHDLAILEQGYGVIAGQIETDKFNLGWFQVEFGCEESCEVSD
jgi:hypothetical protein